MASVLILMNHLTLHLYGNKEEGRINSAELVDASGHKLVQQPFPYQNWQVTCLAILSKEEKVGQFVSVLQTAKIVAPEAEETTDHFGQMMSWIGEAMRDLMRIFPCIEPGRERITRPFDNEYRICVREVIWHT